MRHQKLGRQLSRDAKGRKTLIRGLLTALVVNGKIETTITKAKFLRRNIEKMITFATKKPKQTEQRLYQFVPNKMVIEKINKEILPNLKEKSGLTTLKRLGPRQGDQAEMTLVEWNLAKNERETPQEETKVKEEKIDLERKK